MLKQIARAVRLTHENAEVQALQAGEIYDVSPAIGRVLVTDGWAREIIAQASVSWADLSVADDDEGALRSDS